MARHDDHIQQHVYVRLMSLRRCTCGNLGTQCGVTSHRHAADHDHADLQQPGRSPITSVVQHFTIGTISSFSKATRSKTSAGMFIVTGIESPVTCDHVHVHVHIHRCSCRCDVIAAMSATFPSKAGPAPAARTIASTRDRTCHMCECYNCKMFGRHIERMCCKRTYHILLRIRQAEWPRRLCF